MKFVRSELEQLLQAIENTGSSIPQVIELIKNNQIKKKDQVPRKTLILGRRNYELLPYLKEGEDSISTYTLKKRGEKMNANLGSDVGEKVLLNHREIPEGLRDNYLVFPDWLSTDGNKIAYIACKNGQWSLHWGDKYAFRWCSSGYLLRHYML